MQTKGPETPPRLSVCLIVRDEARWIEGALRSVAGLADEVIVVDTGSSDDTITRVQDTAVALGLTLTLRHFTWVDDFAAARNASIAGARGRWILLLDADERIPRACHAALIAFLDESDADCALLELHDASSTRASEAEVLDGRMRLEAPKLIPRIYRNALGPDGQPLRFEGVVHEQASAWLAARGMRVAVSPGRIVHYGATAEVRASKPKLERNLRLLQRRVATAPDDPDSHAYLAHFLYYFGQAGEALRAAEAGWRLWDAQARGPKGFVFLASIRTRILLREGALEAALHCAREARRRHPDAVDLLYLQGWCASLLAARSPDRNARATLLQEARETLQAATKQPPISRAQQTIDGSHSWQAWQQLAATEVLACDLGRAAHAVEQADAALGAEGIPSAAGGANAESSHDLALRLLRAEIALDGGDVQRAETLLQSLVNHPPASLGPYHADVWLLAAECFHAECDLSGFADALGRAREAAKTQGYGMSQRRWRHAQLHGLLGAYTGQPLIGPGPVGQLNALLLRSAATNAWGPPGGGEVPAVLLERFLANVSRHLGASTATHAAAQAQALGDRLLKKM